jgi:hypothetical protein
VCRRLTDAAKPLGAFFQPFVANESKYFIDGIPI